VTQYLKKAREMVLVKISVETDYHSCFDKEQQLSRLLGLKEVVIAPSANSEEETGKNIGIAGAAHLKGLLVADDVLGVAWGRSIYNMAQSLSQVKPEGGHQIEVIQLMGGLAQSGRMNPEEIVKEVASQLGAMGTWLNTPAVVSNRETRDMLMEDRAVARVFEKAKTCTKCLLGLGDVDDTASLRETGAISAEGMQELREKGAVGDILSWFFDVDGNEVISSLSERILSVPLEGIKRVPERIAFTTGPQKTKAIVGASRGGFINALVTDENTADSVIEYLQNH